MTALEKAARALFESYSARAYPDGGLEAEAVWEEGRDGFIDAARAVLMAVREPTSEMRQAGQFRCTGQGFTAMIDAILCADPQGVRAAK